MGEGMCEDAATFACPDGEVDCHGMSLLQVGACKEIIGDKEVQVKASCDGGSGGDVCDFSRLIHCLAGLCDETDDTIAQWIGQCHRVADAMNGMECGDGTGGRR